MRKAENRADFIEVMFRDQAEQQLRWNLENVRFEIVNMQLRAGPHYCTELHGVCH